MKAGFVKLETEKPHLTLLKDVMEHLLLERM